MHPASRLSSESATPSPIADGAAIFDVDGTLCATRSSTSLVWLRRCQHPAWRHALWLASLCWRAPLAWLADQVSRDLADRMVFRQFAGLSRERVAADVHACCQQLLLPACYAEALAEVAAHRAAGRRIILLSGGIDVVLQPLAAALGAELLAQQLVVKEGRFTGEYRRYAMLEEHAESDAPARATQGDNKLAALQRYASRTGIDLDASCAYGDSINDARMLAAVGRAVAINPDRRLARAARLNGWEIRRWSSRTINCEAQES